MKFLNEFEICLLEISTDNGNPQIKNCEIENYKTYTEDYNKARNEALEFGQSLLRSRDGCWFMRVVMAD